MITPQKFHPLKARRSLLKSWQNFLDIIRLGTASQRVFFLATYVNLNSVKNSTRTKLQKRMCCPAISPPWLIDQRTDSMHAPSLAIESFNVARTSSHVHGKWQSANFLLREWRQEQSIGSRILRDSKIKDSTPLHEGNWLCAWRNRKSQSWMQLIRQSINGQSYKQEGVNNHCYNITPFHTPCGKQFVYVSAFSACAYCFVSDVSLL